MQRNEIGFEILKEFIKQFSRMYKKKPYQFLKFLSENSELIQILSSQYLRLFKSSDSINSDISSLISLITAQYTLEVNR